MLVDAAGTGQIAYTTAPEGAPSVLHDCVLAAWPDRAAPPTRGWCRRRPDDPQYNIDDDGPTPLVIGNELLMLDHRYPNSETLPDGSTGYPTFLWTSEDGGRTFTGPGVIGNLAVSGNAIVFGGSQPQLGWITDTMTGGTLFQSTAPGPVQRRTAQSRTTRGPTRPTTGGSRSTATDPARRVPGPQRPHLHPRV